jgi:hypothetical protein
MNKIFKQKTITALFIKNFKLKMEWDIILNLIASSYLN